MRLLMSYRFILMLVSIYGIALSILAAYFVHQHQRDMIKSTFEREVTNRHLALQRSLDSALLIGHSVVGYFNSSVEVTRDEFGSFVKVFRNETPFVRAIEWVPRVLAKDKHQVEIEARKIFPDFAIRGSDEHGQLIPQNQQEEYFPVYYLEPHKKNEKALGFDLASNPDRLTVLELVRDLGTPSITNRIRLIQETPGDENNWGTLIVYPVYQNNKPHNSLEARRANLQGFIVIVLDMDEFMESSLKYLKPAGINLAIYDDAAKPERRLLYYHQSRLTTQQQQQRNPVSKNYVSHHTLSSEIAIHPTGWTINYEAVPGHFDTSVSFSVLATALTGFIITLLIVYILDLLHKRASFLQIDKDSLEELVAKRTRELEYRNRDLETYSYSIAHDLRTPLRSITSFSQILMEDTYDKLDQEQRSYLQRITAAGKKMAQLIDDILKVTRISRHKIEISQVNLSLIVLEQVNQLRTLQIEDERRPIEWRIQESLYTECDPVLMTTVLDNLLENAYKFTARAEQPVIEFGKVDNADEAIYFVRDNGVGLNMKYADKAFEMFERLHDEKEFKGTGIGLATVKRVIEMHGGRVWVESYHGESTTFFFTPGPC